MKDLIIDFGSTNIRYKFLDEVIEIDPYLSYNGRKISIKEFLGKSVFDVKSISGGVLYDFSLDDSSILTIDFGGKKLNLIEICADLIGKIKDDIEARTKYRVKKLILTIPTSFSHNARVALKSAAKLRGVNACLIHDTSMNVVSQTEKGKYLYIDLGACFFSVSSFEIDEIIKTKGHHGHQFGGSDFDREIAEIILWGFKLKNNIAIQLGSDELEYIVEKSKEIKHKLSKKDQVAFEINLRGIEYNSQITKEEFENAIRPYIDAFRDFINQFVTANQKIILSGQAVKTPLFLKMISEFGEYKIIDGKLESAKNKIMEAIPYDIRIETSETASSVVLHRNSFMPASRTIKLATADPNQEAMLIHLQEGDSNIAKENKSIARCKATTFAGFKLSLRMFISTDGIINIVKRRTNEKLCLEHVNGYSDDKFLLVLQDYLQYGDEKIEYETLSEYRSQAIELIESIESSNSEIDKKIKDLQDSIRQINVEDIIAKTNTLADLLDENEQQLAIKI